MPMASMLPHLSSGIGSFEQVIWDLEVRGVSDIDVPVLVLGFESDEINKLAVVSEPMQLFGYARRPTIRRNRYTVQGLNEGTLKKARETGEDV
jgi:hypothetical protein